MHLYCSSLSAVATIYSSILSDLLPVCFSCSNNFVVSRSSLRLSGKINVEILEAMIFGELINPISDLSILF